MKKLILLSTIILVLIIGTAVLAKGTTRTSTIVIPSGVEIEALDRAVNNSSAIGNVLPGLEKIVYIHYKKGFAKPEKNPTLSCYGFLSRNTKLTSIENLVIDPDLSLSAILASADEWDSHTATELFGNYVIDSTANWDSEVPDGRNELSYGNYPQQRVIAVTTIWGYFSGPSWSRRITEFDILFDTDFIWGNAEDNSALMDLQNIATHELGHGIGLADIYNSSCSEVTMYAYSTEGEIKKRSLEQPDITGLQLLYGN